jgi:hypothetical protein
MPTPIKQKYTWHSLAVLGICANISKKMFYAILIIATKSALHTESFQKIEINMTVRCLYS